MEKTIYTMKLHEEIVINDWTTILRVAGGWVYTQHISRNCYQSNFVPFNKEYDFRECKMTRRNMPRKNMPPK